MIKDDLKNAILEKHNYLNYLPCNLMICDSDLNIIFLNPQSLSSLSTIDKIFGVNLDKFHNDPQSFRKSIQSISTSTINANINIGTAIVRLAITKIVFLSNLDFYLINWNNVTTDFQLAETFEALNRSQAFIEFDSKGIVLNANENFVKVLGYYSLEEIKGKHHKIFCEEKYSTSPEYSAFWDKLRSGKFDANQYPRKRKDGKIVWIQASYNPIIDSSGSVIRIVKFATDVTLEKFNSDALSIAMDNSQAVIEFLPDGTVLKANKNFVEVLGYGSVDEILGKHHKIFCEEKYIFSSEYQIFWEKLRSGKFDANQYPRKRKDGRIVWIQASYNPVLDINGKVVKVVKYATDITSQKENMMNLVKTLDMTANQLSSAAEEFTVTATQLVSNADKTNSLANSAASGTEELAVGMKAVTSSTDELLQSIK
jgi:methyl-accepting chemotaxis protein